MIEDSVKNTDEGLAFNQEVFTNLEEITDRVFKVGEVMEEIAASSERQNKGVEQINTAVEQMSKVVQQNAANSEEAASATEELSSQAMELNSMVSEFTLHQNIVSEQPTPSRATLKPALMQPEIALHFATPQSLAENGSNGNGSNMKAEQFIPLSEEDEKTLVQF